MICGAFSWYNIEATHWTVKAIWYSGLVFAFASVSATGLCSASLLRLQCHSQSTAHIRAVVGYQKTKTSPWQARPLQPWIWGCPGLLLKVSILLFIVGLMIDLWSYALTSGMPGLTEDMKVGCTVLEECSASADTGTDRNLRYVRSVRSFGNLCNCSSRTVLSDDSTCRRYLRPGMSTMSWFRYIAKV